MSNYWFFCDTFNSLFWTLSAKLINPCVFVSVYLRKASSTRWISKRRLLVWICMSDAAPESRACSEKESCVPSNKRLKHVTNVNIFLSSRICVLNLVLFTKTKVLCQLGFFFIILLVATNAWIQSSSKLWKLIIRHLKKILNQGCIWYANRT